MNLKESQLTKEDFQISKLEEDEALDYIKKVLIEKAVNFYNGIRFSQHGTKGDFPYVNPDVVRKWLRKTDHVRNGKNGDYIQYKSASFTFFIRKDYSKGWMILTAGFDDPINIHNPPYPYDVKKIRKIGDPSVAESITMDTSYYQSTPEAKEISKLEEGEALNSIKVYIVPKAVKRYTEWMVARLGDEALYFTSGDVLKALKKDWKTPGRIDYQSKLFDGKVKLNFIIEKNASKFVLDKFGGPKIYVGFYDPIDEKYQLYDLFPSQKPQKESLNENNIIPNLTKEEIFRAIFLIKKLFIDELGYDLGKHLKKISDFPSRLPEYFSNSVSYEYKEKGKRVVFGIYKDNDGLWVDRFDQGSKSSSHNWNVNNTLKDLLNENIEPLNFHISKEEEDRALQCIRNRALKWSPPEVGKALKKTEHFRSSHPHGVDKITYEAQVGDKWYGFTVEKDGRGLWIIPLQIEPNSPPIPAGYRMRVMENVEKPQGTIDKEEEAHGFIFIKRGLVPMAVKTGNDRIRGFGHSEWEQTSVEDVIKNLRKTEHLRSKYIPNTDYIEYSYSQPRKLPLRFWIKKGSTNKFDDQPGKLVLMAGYEHPIKTEFFNYVVSFTPEGRPNTFSENIKMPI